MSQENFSNFDLTYVLHLNTSNAQWCYSWSRTVDRKCWLAEPEIHKIRMLLQTISLPLDIYIWRFLLCIWNGFMALSLSKVVHFILLSFHLMEPLGLPIVKLWCNKVYRLCCRCYLCEMPIACVKWKRLRYYCTLTKTTTEKRRELFRVFLRSVAVRVFSRGWVLLDSQGDCMQHRGRGNNWKIF